MRLIAVLPPIALLALAAPPASGQTLRSLELMRDAQASADAQALRNRDIQIANELAALQSRLQAEQAVSNLQAQRINPVLPTVNLGPDAKLPVVDVSKLVSIPDATLARSNAAVLAASENRR